MSLANHSAPGTAAAFDYQFARALLWLTQSGAGFVVGVETNDDVAVNDASGKPSVLEQNKHSIQPEATPFGDRSPDLWKTLAIWVKAVQSGEVSDARFLMVTNKVLPSGLAHQIASATSTDEIEKCVQALRMAAEDPPAKLADTMAFVLAEDSATALRKVIGNAELADGSSDSAGSELESQTISNLPLPTWCAGKEQSIFHELLGWLHSTVLAKWQSGQSGWIERDAFVNRLHAALSERKRSIQRERAVHLIPVPDEMVGQQRGSVFVRQLHLISDDSDVIDTAIRDYIRCNLEKTRLSAEGNITDQDWLTFESTLNERWKRIRIRITRTNAQDPEEDVGFAIYTDTTEAHCEALAGSPTEQVYLTAGTYHRLAGLLRVGWHPRFAELLAEEAE